METASARLALARAVVLQARERARIVRDRYEVGLSGITDLLRATSAVLDAESLDAEARGHTLVVAARLDRALGRIPRAAFAK
jgi:outer membrane protein TolC